MHAVQIGVYADEFLAQIPELIHSFAVGRLASPAFETVDVARTVALDNARKLSSLSLKRENAAEIEQLHRVEATGDADKENELLRAAIARAQKRHGLSIDAREQTPEPQGHSFFNLGARRRFRQGSGNALRGFQHRGHNGERPRAFPDISGAAKPRVERE